MTVLAREALELQPTSSCHIREEGETRRGAREATLPRALCICFPRNGLKVARSGRRVTPLHCVEAYQPEFKKRGATRKASKDINRRA